MLKRLKALNLLRSNHTEYIIFSIHDPPLQWGGFFINGKAMEIRKGIQSKEYDLNSITCKS